MSWITDLRRQVADAGFVYVRETTHGQLWSCPKCPAIIGQAATIVPRSDAETARRRKNIEHSIDRILRRHTHAKPVRPSHRETSPVPPAVPPSIPVPPAPTPITPPPTAPEPEDAMTKRETYLKYIISLREPFTVRDLVLRLSAKTNTISFLVSVLSTAGVLDSEPMTSGGRLCYRYRTNARTPHSVDSALALIHQYETEATKRRSEQHAAVATRKRKIITGTTHSIGSVQAMVASWREKAEKYDALLREYQQLVEYLGISEAEIQAAGATNGRVPPG